MGISQQLLTMLLLGATGDLSFQQLTLTTEGIITAQRSQQKVSCTQMPRPQEASTGRTSAAQEKKANNRGVSLIRSAA